MITSMVDHVVTTNPQIVMLMVFTVQGHQVTMKMKTVHFVVKSRSCPTTRPVSSADELYKVASDLLRTEIQSCSPQPLRLRLMGNLYHYNCNVMPRLPPPSAFGMVTYSTFFGTYAIYSG